MKNFLTTSSAVCATGVLLAVAGCGSQPTTPSAPAAPPVIVSPTRQPVSIEKAKTDTKTPTIPQNAQRITIELPSGYKIGSTTAKVGVPLALTFKLAADAGCGDEVDVPMAHWRKKLKVGESATVVFTPQKTGDVKFACSMDMYKGTIIVK